MSWETVKWVQENAPVRGSAFQVLLALALRMGKNETVWPSIRRLAQDARMNKDTVRKAIVKLEGMGVIEIRRLAGKVNVYSINRGCTASQYSGVRFGRVVVYGPNVLNNQSGTIKEKQPPAGRGPTLLVDMNANETLALLKKEEPLSDPAMVEKLNGMTQSLSNATRVWREMSARWHGGFLPEFTKKEMGQFKMFLQRSPSGRALAIIGVAIRHWEMISKPKGMHRPHIGFLLTKLGEADQLLHEVLVREERKETKGPGEMEVGW